MTSRDETTLYSAIAMLITIAVIAAIVFGYKHCQAVDERIQECMRAGNHSAAECRDAFAIEGKR